MNGKDEGTYKVICLCLKIKDIPNLWQSELVGKTCSTNAILGVAFFHAKKTYLGAWDAWMHTQASCRLERILYDEVTHLGTCGHPVHTGPQGLYAILDDVNPQCTA